MYFLKSTVFLFHLVLIDSQVTAFMLRMQNMNVTLKDTIRAVKFELNHIIELMHNLNTTFEDTINSREEDIPQEITAASPNDVSTIRDSVENVRKIHVVIPLLSSTSQPEQEENSPRGLFGTFQYLFKALNETPIALNETSVTMKPDVIRKRNSSSPKEANYTNYTNNTKVAIPRLTIRSRHGTKTRTTTEPWNLDNILFNVFNHETSASGTLKSNKTQMKTRRVENNSVLYSLSDYIPQKGSSFITLPKKKTRTFLAPSLCLTEKCGVSMITRSKLNRPVRNRYTSPFSQYNPLHSIFLKNSIDLRNPTFNLTLVKKSTTLPPLEEDLYKFVMYYT